MRNQKILNYNETKEKALRLLEFRNHTTKELTLKLTRAGAKTEDIERVIRFLEEYNLINDAEYAKKLAIDLQNLKKYGKRRIRSELYSKGISSEDIEEAIMELPEPDAEVLPELVKKRLRGDFEQKSKDRVIRYFIYRGYSINEIKECINMAEQEEEFE